MQALFLVLQVLVGIGLITLILLQHGKGADAGAAFGSGASATVFGARGSATFLTKATAVLAILFFSNCFFLNYLSANAQGPKSILEEEAPSTTPTGILESSITPIEEDSKTQEPPQSDLPALPGGQEAPGGDLPAASGPTPETPSAETPKDTPADTPAPAASEPTPKPVEGSEATAEPAPVPAAEPATKPTEPAPAAAEPPPAPTPAPAEKAPAASKPKAAPAKPETSKKKAEPAPTKRSSPEPKAKDPEQPEGKPGHPTDKKTTEQKTP